jgi:AcrR family transcriptional regulator
MNNKRDKQAEETYIQIVQAGVRLFARQGYHKTTIADLAQAIGLTTGAILHHFPTKDAILDAVVDWVKRGIHDYADIANRAQHGSIDVVEEVVRTMCNHFHRSSEATICLAALATEFAGSNHPMETKLKGIYDVFVESFARILQNNDGVTNPRAAAITFLSAAQGIAVQALLREGELTVDELAEGFVSMMKRW